MADLKKQFKDVKALIGNESTFQLTDEDKLRYQDVLVYLKARGYIHDFNVDNANLYRVMAKLDGFEEWLDDELKAAKSVTRREWTIGVVCAIIGAAVGLIPYIVSLFIN